MAPEGIDRQNYQLMVREHTDRPSERSTRPRRILGLAWCSIGSAFVVMAPVLANVLIAFGAAVAMCDGTRRERLLTLVVALSTGCVAAFLLMGPFEIPAAIIPIAGGYALARWMVLGRLDTNRSIAVAAVVACLMLGIDVISTTMQGTSVTDVFATAVDGLIEQNIDALDLNETAVLLESRDQVMAYWPTMYFGVGLGIMACSVFGAWLGVRTSNQAPEAGMLQRFDVPMWVPLLFSAGVVVELVAPHLPSGQDVATMVGANIVMCARLVLAQQGISVLLRLMSNKGVTKSLRMLIVMVAVWLEMSFALTSIVGLLDVGLNFRHLERERPDLIQRPARER